jgi:hypothetical protein
MSHMDPLYFPLYIQRSNIGKYYVGNLEANRNYAYENIIICFMIDYVEFILMYLSIIRM